MSKKLLIILLCIFLVGCSKSVPVYYSSGGTELSDFDDWLVHEYGLNWVPSYLVCRDNKAIGVIECGKSIAETKKEFNELKKNEGTELPEITVDDGNISLSGYTFIEIHMKGCPDCEAVDEDGATEIIRKAFPTVNFIRYYIKSEK